MKKILFIMALFLFSLSLTSCNYSNDSLIEDYPLLQKDNIVHTIDAKTFLDKISNKETFAIMLGFPSCPWCQELMPHYNLVAKSLGIKELFYIDIKDMRDNPESSDRIYFLAIDEYLELAKDTTKDRINAPTIVIIKNGKFVSYHLNTVESHQLDSNGVLPPLSLHQTKELEDILKVLFNDL